MSKQQSVKDAFLENVKDHEMLVEQDNGVFRCLKFAKPGTMNCYFRLVTWPGHLAVSGDMGDYIFARLTDMFRFFRQDDLGINYVYWQEKLKAASRFGCDGGKWEVYDGEGTAQNIKEALYDQHEGKLPKKEIAAILKSIKESSSAEEFFHICALNDIDDAYEYISEKPNFHIQWIMYAIVWGIQKYDLTEKARAI